MDLWLGDFWVTDLGKRLGKTVRSTVRLALMKHFQAQA
jgi:hypothetical protein